MNLRRLRFNFVSNFWKLLQTSRRSEICCMFPSKLISNLLYLGVRSLLCTATGNCKLVNVLDHSIVAFRVWYPGNLRCQYFGSLWWCSNDTLTVFGDEYLYDSLMDKDGKKEQRKKHHTLSELYVQSPSQETATKSQGPNKDDKENPILKNEDRKRFILSKISTAKSTYYSAEIIQFPVSVQNVLR